MPVAEAIITGGDATTVNIQILVTDIGGAGIRHVQVQDRLTFILDDRDVQGCPDHLEFHLGAPLARMRLGVDVIVTDCNNGVTRFRGLLSGEPDPQSGGFPNCSPLLSNGPSPACLDAQAATQNARNMFIQGCNELNDMRNRRDHLLRLIAIFYAASVGFAIAGVLALAGLWWLAAILLITALFFLSFALSYTVLLHQVMNLILDGQAALNRLSEQFQAAARRVRQSCCESNVNLDQPSC
jgi:hypothetical protein